MSSVPCLQCLGHFHMSTSETQECSAILDLAVWCLTSVRLLSTMSGMALQTTTRWQSLCFHKDCRHPWKFLPFRVARSGQADGLPSRSGPQAADLDNNERSAGSDALHEQSPKSR